MAEGLAFEMDSLIQEARRLAAMICHHPRFTALRGQEEAALADPERRALLERYEQEALRLNAAQSEGEELDPEELKALQALRERIREDPANVELSNAQQSYRELMEKVNGEIHAVLDRAFKGEMPADP